MVSVTGSEGRCREFILLSVFVKSESSTMVRNISVFDEKKCGCMSCDSEGLQPRSVFM